MIYRITANPNTLDTSPVRLDYDMGLTNQINRIIVHIPEGHKELAGLKVLTLGRILIPQTGSGELWIRGNGNTPQVFFSPPLVLDGPPYSITLQAYNSDDTYPHSFTVEIS